MKNLKSVFTALTIAASVSLAHAEVVVVVSAKSSVGPMTKQQVSDIFLGKAAAFPDGKLAVPIDQSEGAAARDEFHNKVTGKSGAQLKSFWSKQVFSGKGTPPKEVAGNPDVKKLATENPNMIGYLDRSAVDGGVKVVFTP